MPRFGETLDLAVQLPDGNASQFVQATVRDPNGNVLSTVNLANIASGFYLAHSTMPGFRTVFVTYEVFSDSGYTTPNGAYPITLQKVQLDDASDVTIVGTVDGYATGFVPIVQGEDRMLNLQLVQRSPSLGINGAPLDISGVTAAIAAFANADGTKLVKTIVGGGIVIFSPLLGTMGIGLLDTETLNLKVGERQTFELQLSFGSVIRIIQFTNALSVAAKVVLS